MLKGLPVHGFALIPFCLMIAALTDAFAPSFSQSLLAVWLFWLLVMAVAWVLLHTVKRSSAQLQADVIGQNKVVLTFVTNHLPISEGEKLVKVLLDICQPTCCIKVRT